MAEAEATVTKLEPLKPRTPEGMVRLLCELLDQAERGELLSLVIVGERTTDKGCFTAYSKGEGTNFFALIGLLVEVQQKLAMRTLIDNGEIEPAG